MNHVITIIFTTLFSICAGTMAESETLGPVILEVRSEASGAPTAPIARFDMTALEKIGLIVLSTKTPWTKGEINFQGVLLRDLMTVLKVNGKNLTAYGLNGNSVRIPQSDYQKIDVIIATRSNGERLGIRERGPLWIIYPWSKQPSLQSELYYSRSLWHLKMIGVNTD